MSLIALGINHKTAPLAIREKVAFSADRLVAAFSSLRNQLQARESLILSTCNRTEVYVQGEGFQGEQLTHWLAQFHQLDQQAVAGSSYILEQEQAVKHIMRVASGLDSMILGEPQILGQVKQAFVSAKNSGSVSSHFEKLFQQTFAVAKRVRSETEIGANAISVAYAAVQLAKHIFSSLQHSRVLLIGAGETIELVAKHLKDQKVKQISVANRTLARAEQIAGPIGAQTLTLGQIPNQLARADIVISSTASPLPILGKGMVERALKKRRHAPMFFVDLAVPRDIENEVSELNDAYLYTVDDLQQIVQQNLSNRQSAAASAEHIVAEQAQLYMHWLASQGSVDLLRSFRLQAEQQRDKLTTRAFNQLAEGRDPQQVLGELANKLTNSLIHPSTQALKRAGELSDSQTLALLRQAYGLDNNE